MSEQNPFAVSEHSNASRQSALTDPGVHPAFRELIQLLIETRPWVRFIGIMTMIAAVLMVIGGLVATLGGFAGGRMGGVGFAGLIYLVMSMLYIYPALCLMRFASSITEAELSGQMANVNEAILHQKKFWRFCGIVAVLVLIFYALSLVGVMLVAFTR